MLSILNCFWFELMLCGFFVFLKISHGCFFFLIMFLKEPLGKVLDSF
jgi:hypothetical protein